LAGSLPDPTDAPLLAALFTVSRGLPFTTTALFTALALRDEADLRHALRAADVENAKQLG
jgi:hypothetical protein